MTQESSSPANSIVYSTAKAPLRSLYSLCLWCVLHRFPSSRQNIPLNSNTNKPIRSHSYTINTP